MPEECFPRFDPTPWDGKVTRWDHKMFIMEGVRTLMHVPLKFGGVMTRLQTKVKTAHATMRERCKDETHERDPDIGRYPEHEVDRGISYEK